MNKKIRFSKETEEKLKKLEISELLQHEKWTFQDIVAFIVEAIEDERLEKGIYKEDICSNSIRKAFVDSKRGIPKKLIKVLNIMWDEKELNETRETNEANETEKQDKIKIINKTPLYKKTS